MRADPSSMPDLGDRGPPVALTVARQRRKPHVWRALGFGVLAWVLIGSAVVKHGGALALGAGLLFAAGSVAEIRVAFRKPVTFTFDGYGIVVARGRRSIPWSQVVAIHLARYQNNYGEEHNLIFKLRPGASGLPRKFITTNATNPNEVEVPLDDLSEDRHRIVSAIETASGLRVQAVREGPFRLRSYPDRS